MVSDGLCFIENLMERLDDEELGNAVMVAKRIWLRRNNIVHGGELCHPTQLVKNALEASIEFLQANSIPESCTTQSVSQIRLRWILPLEGMVKTNWDAAVDIPNKKVGVGVVVRDEGGNFLASLATTVPFIVDPVVAEAVAAWKAVSFSRDLGLQRVIFKGDALEIVNALGQESPCWSRYGQVIEDAKIFLHSF
jgi:hypothetical protein